MIKKILALSLMLSAISTSNAFAADKSCQTLAQQGAKQLVALNGAQGPLKALITGWKMAEGDLDLWKIEILEHERDSKRKITLVEVITGQSEGPCQISSITFTGETK